MRRRAIARWFALARHRRYATGIVVSALVLGAVNGLIGPVTLFARGAAKHSLPENEDRRRLTEQLVELISSSRAVILHRPWRNDAGVDLLLWQDDVHDPGRINPDEIVLISHSRVLRAITLYRMDQRANRGSEIPVASVAPGDDEGLDNGSALFGGFDNAGFCDRWRTSAHVNGVVLATDVRELELTELHKRSDGMAKLHIGLTWHADSVDTPDSATVIVAATWRSLLAKE